MRLLRLTRFTVVTILLVMTLAFNVATVAISSVATLAATAYSTVTGAKAVTTQLREQIIVRDRQIASLSGEVAELRAAKQVTYRGQKKLVSEAVEDTTKRVSRRTATNAARNVTSVFGEAIPVIGVGVIVAVTGLELADACETMEDLQELDVAFNPDNAIPEDVSEVCGLEVPSKEEVLAAIKASPGKAWEKAKQWVPDMREWASFDVSWWDQIDWWPFD